MTRAIARPIRQMPPRWALVLPGIAAAACFLSGCGRDELPEAPKRFVYPPQPAPVATKVPADTHEWVGLAKKIQEDLTDVEKRMDEDQKIFRENSFDAFLDMDLSTMEKDQLAYLWHFADKGYFTVEREIMVKILEDRQVRPVALDAGGNIAHRAQRLAETYQNRLHDFKTALELYQKTKMGDFHIPGGLDQEQIEVLRDMVREKLAEARRETSRLDARIAELTPTAPQP
jgi:hypothetical protein